MKRWLMTGIICLVLSVHALAISSDRNQLLFGKDGTAPFGAWISKWGSSESSIMKLATDEHVIRLDGKALAWGFNNHTNLDGASVPEGSRLSLKYRCVGTSAPGNIEFTWKMASGVEQGRSTAQAAHSSDFKQVELELKAVNGMIKGIVLGVSNGGSYEFTDIVIIKGEGKAGKSTLEKVILAPDGAAPMGAWISPSAGSKVEKTLSPEGIGILALDGNKFTWTFNNHHRWDFGAVPDDHCIGFSYRTLEDIPQSSLKLTWLLASGEEKGENQIHISTSPDYSELRIPLRRFSGIVRGFSLEAERPLRMELADISIMPAQIAERSIKKLVKNISGRVVSEGKAIPGALVELQKEAERVFGWEPVKSVISQGLGNFSLQTVSQPRARLALEVSAAGFQTRQVHVDTDLALDEQVEIALVPYIKASAEIKINREGVLTEINPLIFGSNVAVWHQGDFKSEEYVRAAKESGVKFIRYPGGGKSQHLYWQHEDVKWYETPPSGGSKRNDCVITPRMLSEFAAFSRGIGAEPLFTLNNRAEDVENLADLVKYAKENNLGIRYYEIGNEPLYYGWPEKERKDVYSKVARLHLEIEKAIRKAAPEIIVMGPAAVNANVYPDLKHFLEPTGGDLEMFSVHRYPQDDDRTKNFHLQDSDLLAKPAEWSELVPLLKSLTAEYTRKDVPLAITEWNTAWAKPSPRSQGIAGALFIAKNLCEMIKNGISAANYWFLSGNGGYELYSHKNGKVTRFHSFYAFKMLANNFHGTMIESESDQPLLSVYSARRGENIVIAVVNTSPDTEYECSIKGVDGGTLRNSVRLSRISQEEQGPDIKKFPPYSFTLLTMEFK